MKRLILPHVVIGLCMVLGAYLHISGAILPRAGFKTPTDSPRTGSELCREVEYEMIHSVRARLLAQDQADAIVKRCFKLYGDSK